MTTDVDAVLANVDIVAVVEARVDLVKEGANFRGLCPLHGESTPSFTVSSTKQFYHCFGCGAHGDAIDFIREMDGLSFKEACAELTGDHVFKPKTNGHAHPVAERGEWKHCTPTEPLKTTWLPALGNPIAKYEYKTTAGETLLWVCRYNDPDKPGGKQIRCFSFGTDGAAPAHWACRQPARPRPLYGLEKLAEREPDRQILLLEGEGKCDAAQRLLPGLITMSWLMGAANVRHADYSPLDGRQIILLPDNDEPGREAVKWLRQALIGRRCGVKVIEPEETRPGGWNLDDAEREGWTPEQTRDWARSRLASTLIPAADPRPEPPPPREPPPPPVAEQLNAAKLSEIDLADKFVLRSGDNWRFVAEWGVWYKWMGDGWREEKTKAIKSEVLDMMREVPDWPDAGSLSPSAKRSLSSGRTINATAELVGVHRRIAASASQWDRDPWMLGVPGGVVDLREGKVVTAVQEDHITLRCQVAPERGQPALWLAHLARVQSPEMIGFLRRYIGSMLVGKAFEHAMVFLFGPGGNGKGTIIETIVRLMGDYGYAAPVNLLMESKNERHPAELAMLRGKRVVSCSEPAQGMRWDENRITWLTGGDTITARMMGQDFTSFEPSHKLLVMGNHKPTLRSVTPAMKRRFNIVDFSVQIPQEEVDIEFLDKLKGEWPQILQWMIDGCLEWQRVGLGQPQEVREATSQYLQGEDALGEFIDECCDRKGSDPVAAIYRAYTAWCERSGERATTQRLFVNALYERPGITRGRTASSRMVMGIQLKVQQTGYGRDE